MDKKSQQDNDNVCMVTFSVSLLTVLLSLSSRLLLVTVQLCSSSSLSTKGVPPVAMSQSSRLL